MRRPLLPRTRRVRWPRVALLFLAVLLPLLIVGAIAEDLLEKERFAFEAPLLLAIHARATPLYDRVALFFTTVGSATVIAPISAAILLLLWLRGRARALFFAVGVAGAALLDFVLKLVFGRPRPELWPRLVHEGDASFPSGHAMYSAALVAALIFLAWHTKYRWLAVSLGVPFTLLVGFSRLYLGVHYPTDVLAGWLAGVAWVTGTHLIFARRS